MKLLKFEKKKNKVRDKNYTRLYHKRIVDQKKTQRKIRKNLKLKNSRYENKSKKGIVKKQKKKNMLPQ